MYTHLSKDSPLQLRGDNDMLTQKIRAQQKEHSCPTKAQTTLYNKQKLKVKDFFQKNKPPEPEGDRRYDVN